MIETRTKYKSKSPPRHLSKKSKKLWREIFEGWIIDSSHEPLLEICCQSYDRIQEARREIEEHGVVLLSPTGNQKANPALRIEHDATNRFLQAWRQLGLDAEPPKDVGRPPGS